MRICLIDIINNPYNNATFIGICIEYGVSSDLTKWKNHYVYATWQSKAWETGKPGMSILNDDSFSRWIIGKSDGLTTIWTPKII